MQSNGSNFTPTFLYILDVDEAGLIPPLFDASAFSSMLQAPCQISQLVYDDEAFRRESIESLASLYHRRILTDVRERLAEPAAVGALALLGIGQFAAVAHRVALQFQDSGVSLLLIVDAAVILLLPRSWLGGEREAALALAARSGAASIARQERTALSRSELVTLPEGEDETDRLLMRLYWKAVGRGEARLRASEFRGYVREVGASMDRLRLISLGDLPPEGKAVFKGHALFIPSDATYDEEIPGLKMLNSMYCESLEFGRGGITSGSVTKFCKAWLHGIVVFNEHVGHEGARIYFLHDLLGDVRGAGACYANLAVELQPCRVAALVFNDEAQSAVTLDELAEIYARRILADRVVDPSPYGFVVAGYEFGAILAHVVATKLNDMGRAASALILLDGEVSWPPAVPQGFRRVGTYPWLGGCAEACLQLSRQAGRLDFVEREIEGACARGIEARTFAELRAAVALDSDEAQFHVQIARLGACMEKLIAILGPRFRPGSIDVPGLLLRCRFSPEFAPAVEVNESFMCDLSVEALACSHYALLGSRAPEAAAAILRFLSRLPALPETPAALPPESRVAAEPPESSGTAPRGLALLHEGQGGPPVYMVHGLDGDAFSVGSTHATIAPLLAPCRVCALTYDEEALRCSSLPELAALYNRRLAADLHRLAREPGAVVLVTGYSFGCVIAHQMALQLRDAGRNVALVLFDLEVTWPPPASMDRVGGYKWLGGDIEATLLVARAMGAFQLAQEEVNRLVEMRAEDRSVVEFKQRGYEQHASKLGFSREIFEFLISKASQNMEQLNSIADHWEPAKRFDGEALLVLAPQSHEFGTARAINERYCGCLRVSFGLGSHYNLLQEGQAQASANAVHVFLDEISGAWWPGVSSPGGLTSLHAGTGPSIYMVPGIDGDSFSAGSTFATIAPLLSPCNVCSLMCDDEAHACDSMASLCAAYNKRCLWERRSRGTHRERFVVAGFSFGCVIAHQMVLQLRRAGLDVALLLFDLEVTWPPPTSLDRIGGYEWLGGEAEALLLVARTFGAFEFAFEELKRLLDPDADRDVKSLRARAFQELALPLKIPKEIFDLIVDRSSRNMEHLNRIASPWTPPEKFDGETLLLLAPDSMEFGTAEAVNVNYCSKMEVKHGLGTHYSMLQGAQAPSAAAIVLHSLATWGFRGLQST